MSPKRSGNPLDYYPVEQPPAGQTSNFVDPPSLGPELIAVEASFTALMLLTVALRVFVSLKWTKSWVLGDYTCIIAALGSVVHMVMIIESTNYGFGRHMWDIPVSWVLVDKNIRVSLVSPQSSRVIADVGFYQIMSSSAIIFPFTILFAKVSILLIYLRLFKIDRPLRISIHVGLVLMALFHTIIIGIGINTVVKCVGISGGTSTFCKASGGSIQLAQSTFNLVTDIWILLLPMPLLKKLQLPRTRKIGLLFVFGAGIM
ncbi:hypothetical protein N0V82_008745 [Gnomoniopsis sp. IMI 355080]|nr:hypothetical protein N0V82_008745 [Gnomoniopsis sp. IMI 355080]